MQRKGHLQQEAVRIAYLDALRGIAALLVAVFWHYRHFSDEFQPGGFPLTTAPYYGMFPFRLSYKYGFVAVDLFFVISGFVFSHVYSEAIAQRRVSAKRFFIKRFSRLYPLHLATLLYVAVIALTYQYRYGVSLMYPIDDGYHFLLNLVFMQKGFFDHGYSFNGPSWSLSIEAFLYLLFFLVARRGLHTGWAAVMIAVSLAIFAAGWHYSFLLNEEIARGLGGFFTGVLLYKAIAHRQWPLLAIPPALIAATLGILHYGGVPYGVVLFYSACWLGFGALILLAHHLKPLRRVLEVKPLQRLGELSLAIYLLHVPLQMSIICAFKAWGAPVPCDSALFLMCYAGILIGLSGWVYHRFEMPAQRYLRKKLSYPSAASHFTATLQPEA